MSISSFLGAFGTTLIQYLAIFGVVALGCLPSLEVTSFRTRIETWPTDRFWLNYVLLVGVIAVGQVAVIVVGWNLLRIGSTQADPQFRLSRFFGLLIGYPITGLAIGVTGARLYYSHQSKDQWLTPRTIAGLTVATGMYIVTVVGAAIVLLIVGIFIGLPT